MNKKVIGGMICAASVIIAAGILLSSPSRKQDDDLITRTNLAQVVQNDVQDIITPVPTFAPQPTATPKPLPSPTATPTPIPTPTDIPNEDGFTEEINDSANFPAGGMDNNEGEWDLSQVLFIGDQRVRSMVDVSDGRNDFWQYQDYADYDWLVNNAFADAEDFISDGTAVVISMGLYDTENVELYSYTINQKAEEWKEKGAKVFFSSVGPVGGENIEISNQKIMDFNTAMFKSLNTGFIDTYNYLVAKGFTMSDDVCYDEITSLSMYRYIKDNIC